ncbi:MAG: CDP-glycerol glycerophosphotransferase family protein [Parachlamydiales bacterium]|jgi:hypothetical protein
MTTSAIKGVAFVGDQQIHNADHLAPIAFIMDIPLLFLSDSDTELCTPLYPNVNIQTQPYGSFGPEEMIQLYDVLFISDIWPQAKFENTFRELEIEYNKRMRRVFCPHGYSDKSYYFKNAIYEDIKLVYGRNLLDTFKDFHVDHLLKDYVITGNYRYTYYKQNKAFYDQIAQDKFTSQFARKQLTAIYAPTWMDIQDASTFFDVCETMLDNLPAEMNILVKLHPRLELHSDPDNNMAPLYHHLIGKYSNKPNIVFIENFPVVFPLLNAADIYIGDNSSVGYDFLAFNKPMFFLNKFRLDPHTDRNATLFKTGTNILPENYPQLYSIIEKNLSTDQVTYEPARIALWDYTFGTERAFAQIRNEISALIKTQLI